MRRHSNIAFIVLKYFLLLFAAFTTLFPFYMMVVSTFKTEADYEANYFSLPKTFIVRNYTIFFNRFDVMRMTINSLIVSVVPVLILIVIVSMAAFIFTKAPFRYSNLIFTVITACTFVPQVVILIPAYQMMSFFKLINHHISLIFMYTARYIPYFLFLSYSYFKTTIPNECVEAARIDGANLFSIYVRIAMPLSKSVIITIFTLGVLWNWNELLYAMLFLQTEATRTLNVGIATIVGKRVTNMPLLFTGLFVNSIPMLILFLVGKNYIEKGLSDGSVKE